MECDATTWLPQNSAVIGEALLTHLSCTGMVCPEDVEAIRRIKGEIRTIQRHKVILSPGDIPRFGVIVLKGFLYRYAISKKGARQIHSFCMPTDSPGLEALHLDYVDDSLAALVSSVVGLVPYANIFRLMESRPSVAALIERAAVLQGSIYRETARSQHTRQWRICSAKPMSGPTRRVSSARALAIYPLRRRTWASRLG